MSHYLRPLGLPPRALARALKVSPSQIHRIIKGKLGITADMAYRLGRFFENDPLYWLNLQNTHDLYVVRETEGKRLNGMVTPYSLRDA